MKEKNRYSGLENLEKLAEWNKDLLDLAVDVLQEMYGGDYGMTAVNLNLDLNGVPEQEMKEIIINLARKRFDY